jgi:hypothetical protein
LLSTCMQATWELRYAVTRTSYMHLYRGKYSESSVQFEHNKASKLWADCSAVEKGTVV